MAVMASPNCVPSTVLCNFVNADGHFISDATVANGSVTISCPNNDCNFTSTDAYGRLLAKVGQLTFATTNPLTGTLACPQGTIATIATQSLTVSPAGQCTQNLTGSAYFIWGSDDSTNLATFWNNVGCGHGVLPQGFMLTQQAQFITTPSANCNAIALTIFTSNSLAGQNLASTWIVPTPNFNAATCNGNQSQCFGSAGANDIRDISIWGGGNPRTASGTTHAILELGSFTRGYNVNATGWGTNELLWDGIVIAGSQDVLQLSGAESAGGGCAVRVNSGTVNPVTLYGNFHSGSGNNLCVSNSSSVIGIDEVIAAGRSGFAGVKVNSGGTLSSFGDIYASGTGASAVQCDGICQFHDAIVGTNVAGTFAVFTDTGTGKVTAENTTFVGSAGGGSLSLASATSFTDECGNTFTQNGGANSINAGANVIGSCSAGGTLLVAGNVGLSANWGTSAAVSAPLGDAHAFSFTLTNGSAAVGANPTITLTYPVGSSVPFMKTPICNLWQVGGTQAVTATTAILPPTSGSTTSVVFTFPATPTVNLTEFYQGSCGP